jgi:hypothetical protein
MSKTKNGGSFFAKKCALSDSLNSKIDLLFYGKGNLKNESQYLTIYFLGGSSVFS